MIKKLFLYGLIFSLYPAILSSQEIVTGLQINPAVRNLQNKPHQKKISVNDTLNLPFFDDFSGSTVIPDPKLWSDDYAFINNTYSDQQPTVGIATLDAIDNTGKLYETASSEVFEADHLTSQPINLSYPASSGIYLSFFYQPGGLGDPPELQDSLTLQFYAPAEAQWYSVWRAEGSAVQSFKPAVVKIDQPRYLMKGFRFRFVNYASLSSNMNDPSMLGNCDIWNLDYVYLNRNRNANDTTISDVAFRLPIRSLLKTHESMPWKQFRQVYLQEMGSFITIHYRNNDTIVRNVTRNFVIRDLYANTLAYSFSAGATNIDPLTNVDYDANLIYTFNSPLSDSAFFGITCILKTDEFDPKQNDTIKYNQVFNNYFAFDDGTSEGGYGINGLGSRNAMVAYRFESYMQDTVRAIRICFNDSYMNSNQRAFDLMIWGDNNGIPGDIIYTVENVIVELGYTINGFAEYILPEGVPVDGVFYVGWKQRSETFLNAGFDINTPNRGRQLYWLNGEWIQSQVNGSIMIRPVVGKALKTTGIDDVVPETKSSFTLWPNPASGRINLRCPGISPAMQAYVIIIDLQGHELIKVPYEESIDISTLKAGIYTVIPILNNRPLGHLRLVKIR